jgi:hypothetical protein
MYGQAPRVLAYLAERGFDLSQSQIDWTGSNRMVTSLNATQPMRIRQATHYVKAMTPAIASLVDEWKDAGGLTRYKLLNSATLGLSMNAGGELGEIASKLDGSIADLQGEIGIVLMGGYAPTNHALELAAKNIQANWDEQMLMGNLTRIDTLMDMREESQKQITPNVPGGGASQYWRPPGGGAASTQGRAPMRTEGIPAGTSPKGVPQVWMTGDNGKTVQRVAVTNVEAAIARGARLATEEEVRGGGAKPETK